MKRKAAFGLGNPGKLYEHTRHNLGLQAIDHYLKFFGQKASLLEKSYALVYRLDDLLLVKPLVYMNLSGLAVKEVYSEFGLRLEDCLIVYDDFAIPFGQLRAKARGGAGGHHGMESVIAELGSEEIPRLRIGIGTEEGPGNLTEYVLGELSLKERQLLSTILDRAAEAIDCFFKKGITAVMNNFN